MSVRQAPPDPVPVGYDLSVIVPTYNYGAYLEAAIRSVFAVVPTGRRVEVVVADDGSTDHTHAILEQLSSELPVRSYRQKNRGPAAARNLALSHAAGNCFMLLDADDSILPGCIEVTLDFLDRHPEAGMFFTNYDIYDEDGIVHPSGVDTWSGFRSLPHSEDRPGEWVFKEPMTAHLIGGGSFIHTSGLTLRRSVYEQAGPFLDAFAYGEDDEFYARAAWICTAGYVDRVLTRKRNHASSLIHAPANQLRNLQHSFEISNIQRRHYEGDAGLRRILDRKIRDDGVNWAWHLIKAGKRRQAWGLTLRLLRSYPTHGKLYRLLARSLLPASAG